MKCLLSKRQALLSACLILGAVHAKAGWQSKKPRPILVAVIDTGIDTNHKDLKNHLWTNPRESGLDPFGHDKATNGIDDDGNGFIDDVHGWNFTKNNNDLTDVIGHGTHIAGIILGKSNLEKRAPATATQVQVMALKYYDPDIPPALNILNTVRAIRYAVKMKVDIINFSAGGPGANVLEQEAIEQAADQQILFVTAAGNESLNIDRLRYYPASYRLPNILAVTATDANNRLLPTSNYGELNVDIAAEGKDLVSTLPGNKYGKMTGTSQATAVVTRKAVSLAPRMAKSEKPKAVQELISRVLSHAEALPHLTGKTKFSSRISLDAVQSPL